jgi:hypothetical protein
MYFLILKLPTCVRAFTISVVVWGTRRKRSRIERRLLSDKAFDTPSRSLSGHLGALRVRLR